MFLVAKLESYVVKEELKMQFKKIFFDLFQKMLQNHKNSLEEEKSRAILKKCC